MPEATDDETRVAADRICRLLDADDACQRSVSEHYDEGTSGGNRAGQRIRQRRQARHRSPDSVEAPARRHPVGGGAEEHARRGCQAPHRRGRSHRERRRSAYARSCWPRAYRADAAARIRNRGCPGLHGLPRRRSRTAGHLRPASSRRSPRTRIRPRPPRRSLSSFMAIVETCRTAFHDVGHEWNARRVDTALYQLGGTG